MASLSDDFSRWERRLTREEPFLTGIFDRHGVRRVLDLACGTGRHAVRLAERGYEVTGVDLNAESLESARSHAAQRGVEVSFVEGSFLELGRVVPGPFDAVYSVGNSLSFSETEEDVLQALRGFLAVLRPGGVAVAQILNYAGIAEREESVDFVRSFVRDGVEHVVVKFFRFGRPRWDVEFVTVRREGEVWRAELGHGDLLALEATRYQELWRQAGFDDVALFGDYGSTPFDVHTARDAIAVAVRRGRPAQSTER